MTETQRLIQATCPDCRGPLTELQNGDMFEYRCLVGHVFSTHAMLEAHFTTQENTLWASVVALEEAAKLVEAVASQFPPDVAERLKQQAAKKQEQAMALRAILQELEPFELE